MRKVIVMAYTHKEPYKKEEKYLGFFHKWQTLDEPDGNGRYRRFVVGIVEDHGGHIAFVEPDNLRFPEQPT